jgi:hypothetical protein
VSQPTLDGVKGVLAVLIVGLLGGGVAAVVVHKEAPANDIIHTAPTQPPVTETVIVPAAGQTLVSGTVLSLSADNANADPIPAPFSITAVERGAVRNATVEGAIIGGARKTVYWYAGQPLPVSGAGGSLDPGAAHVDVDAHGVTWSLAGGPSSFKPGHYHLGSSVAVGSAGLATPYDGGIDFNADNHTVLTASDGVVVHLDSPALAITGPGTVRITGNLVLRTTAGQRTAKSLTMANGPFKVTLTPGPSDITITATLQGAVTAN